MFSPLQLAKIIAEDFLQFVGWRFIQDVPQLAIAWNGSDMEHGF
jgi:hypothetical protein